MAVVSKVWAMATMWIGGFGDIFVFVFAFVSVSEIYRLKVCVWVGLRARACA